MNFLKNKSWKDVFCGMLLFAAVVFEVGMMIAGKFFLGTLVTFLLFGFGSISATVALVWAIISTVGTIAILLYIVKEVKV